VLRNPQVVDSEITPLDLYLNRRRFMAAAGSLAAGALALAACGASDEEAAQGAGSVGDRVQGGVLLPEGLNLAAPAAGVTADETGAPLNAYDDIVNFNNFYEFTTSKEGVAREAAGFNPTPWTVEVAGLVNKPLTLDLDAIYSRFRQEERVFRMRCVEAWSMVIPWVGFRVRDLLALAEPAPSARYVTFTSVLRPEEMPGQKSPMLKWPYMEALRMDEAMHDLATFATGMYGQPLTRQQGAPFRLVVPWKYGFKSIKSVVRIELVAEQPVTTWMEASPREYGFYANVNPTVSHPRWPQATERRVGEVFRRKTELYNGYAEQVASLYDGMDLTVNF